jgi:membrane protease YdiL (CAAX protease family)
MNEPEDPAAPWPEAPVPGPFLPAESPAPPAEGGLLAGPLPPEHVAGPSPTHPALWFALGVFGVAYAGLWFLGEEGRVIAFAGLQSLPFAPLALFAYLGQRRAYWAMAVTFILWAWIVAGAALAVWLMTVGGLLSTAGPQQVGGRPGPGFLLHVLVPAGVALLGIALGVGLGLLAFHPAARRAAARVLPIDATSFVHATALATVTALTVIGIVPLATLGQPLMERLLPQLTQRMSQGGQSAGETQLREMVYGLAWMVPAAVVAVGYPVRRSFGEALRRLGLVRPQVWQVALGVALIPAFYFATDGVEGVIERLWKSLGWPTTNSRAFDELISFAISPLGAVVVGVTAGLGEEMAVRGVLQPRLGILLSNLFFTSLHALQYNWDGLLSVFLIGLGLGLIRKYTNTTTSAIVHGGYDFSLVLVKMVTGGH